MFVSKAVPVVAAIGTAMASPTPSFQGEPCLIHDEYSIDWQQQETGWTFLVAGATCDSGSAGCSISAGKTYSVTTTITQGTDLSLADIVGVGLSSSISVSTTNADSVTVSANCPKRHNCGLQAIAQMYHIKGTKTPKSNGGGDCLSIPPPEPYEVFLPVLQPGASDASQPVVAYSACTIQGTPPSKRIPGCPPLA